MQDRPADTDSSRGARGRSAWTSFSRCILLALLSTLVVGVSGAQAITTPGPEFVLKEASLSLVEWQSLSSGEPRPDQWGYKVAVSPEACPPPARECERPGTQYFEVQRSPGGPQFYIPYRQNLGFVPVDEVVWIGVGALTKREEHNPRPIQGAKDFPYSEEIPVHVADTGMQGYPAPYRLWTEGDTVYWGGEGEVEDSGAYGYKVAVSVSPRCEAIENKCHRETDTIEVAKSGDGVQSFSPCLEDLNFTPEGDVFVGVGAIARPETNPASYTGSEVAVSVPPCPQPNAIIEQAHVEELHPGGPTPPVSSQAPSVTGTAAVGFLLTASAGAWQPQPNSYAYQWQICNVAGAGCENISGATGTTFPLTGGDFGHRLRVVVTAQNSGGSATAVSSPSPVIGSTVESEVEWSFAWGRSYTIVESLGLHAVTSGAHVEVVCRGAKCPFQVADITPVAHSSGCHTRRCDQTHGNDSGPEADLAHLFKGRHLRPGTVIIVRVTKPGWVGRSYTFTVRTNERPSHPRPTCLAPDSTQPSACVGGS